jgi:imidazolonepropionase-like amidohydrolase/Tol biopolymer transport system component
MNADGTDARNITSEDFRLLNNAVWTPDGQYIIARKHFTSGRSLGAGEMWMYHISGGSGIQLTKRKNDQQDVNEPCVSPDGRYLYYSEDVYPGGYFQYNKDPNSEIYAIFRYDLKSGETMKVTGGPGGASRPQVSRDGKKLAFVKRVRAKSVLYIHHLDTGEEYPVFDGLNKDQQEAWAIFGVYPNFQWMPDNKSIIFWSGGKIRQLFLETLKVETISFSAEVNLKIAEALQFDHEAAPDEFTARVIRHAITSPDEKLIVFSAVGYLWKKALPNGKPVRLTQDTDFEFEPSFSPDGKEIVYVTWNDEKLGEVRRVPLAGGKSIALNREKGIFRNPSFSPDGKTILVRKEGGNNDQGHTFSVRPGIYLLPSAGGELKLVCSDGEYPSFSSDGKRVYYQSGGTFFGNLTKELKSVNLEGKDERTHIRSKYANRLMPSPDNKWLAFIHLHKVYLAAMPASGQILDIDPNGGALPLSVLSRDAGINLHWSADSKKVFWTLGEEYYSAEVRERFTFLPDSPDSIANPDTAGISIGLAIQANKPIGRIAFTNARIITMKGDEVIENGTLVVHENRIESVGKSSEVKVPGDALVFDLKGHTLMPGMVDVHAHIGAFRHGLSTQQHWPFYANLAYGVTTAHDPSAHTESVFALSELQRSGATVGPRLFSTGFILYGADGDFKAVVNSLDDARSAIRRTKAFGALSVKSYNQPRRNQRQQVIQAAREQGIFVVPEGGSTFYHNMTMIMDGHTGVEHNIPVAPVYKDIVELWSNSKTGYTPTLIVNYGGLNAELFWYQKTDVWADEKLLKYTPRAIIDSRSRHRTMVPDEEYENGHILVSETCKKLADAGVKVNLGAHGQLQGLGAHWELWSLGQGGMSNHDALRAATINGADYIGMAKDIGSLEPGKLADLIVLEKNPLEDLRNSNTVKFTMVNGRLYDTATMNEVGNYDKPRGRFFWENPGYNVAFRWHQGSRSFMPAMCGCVGGAE